MAIDKARATEQLRAFEFRRLFVEELGWDNPTSRHSETVTAGDATFALAPVAEKRGVRIFHCTEVPDRAVRQRIEREVTKLAREHLIIFTDAAKTRQIWQWVASEKGRPAAFREHLWLVSQSPDPLLQKLDHIAFSLDEEEGLTLFGTTVRMRDAFDRERITRRFYDEFKCQHDQFLGFIKGLTNAADKAWYASLMLNRLMFVYFIQKKGFLDGDLHYLRTKLNEVQAERGKDKFHSFYRAFLLKLFHGGLATPKEARDVDAARIIGNIPYLNGGLFEPHALEGEGNTIQIADAAFESIFAFFDGYEWTLDTRAIERADGREINPDVLGHIFEKYINQKQMGAYYTKEDITDYITRSTVIPWLFHNAEDHDKVAFERNGAVWRMLSENPDAYIFKSVRHGTQFSLPDNVVAGFGDVARRSDWNKTASADIGLTTETWREVIIRRERYESVKAKVAAGEISSIEDFITFNLDIRQFALDVIQYSESPDLVRAFWKAISGVKVLDPACGSGAFLFAALNILYDLYDACLERMEQFVETAPQGTAGRQFYTDFRDVLARIARHPSRSYFIYKSIILDNLYGVDIMDEAVEICKLRLFLKLAAQLQSDDQIEPLPDIDFNIRAGNSLIGYTSFDDVRRAMAAKGFDFDDRASKIEAAAQDLDAAFRLFRQQQTELHGSIDGANKANLRAQLAALGGQLDRFLAQDYGIVGGEDLAWSAKFDAWKASHKPFHWLVEFYGIVSAGGFEVLIGNPPYIEMKELSDYAPKGFATTPCGNLYALFLERSEDLADANARSGYIVPVSSISADRYQPLQTLTKQRATHISSFDDRPSRLFDGLEHIRLAIHLSGEGQCTPSMPHTTKYHRWFGVERDSLFETISYAKAPTSPVPGSFPKIDGANSESILRKLVQQKGSIGQSSSRSGKHHTYYTRKVGHFLQIVAEPPEIHDEAGKIRLPSELKSVRFDTDRQAKIALSILNSSLFYWYFVTFSDCRNVNKREVEGFPLDVRRLDGLSVGTKLHDLGTVLAADLKENAEFREMSFGKQRLRIECIFPGRSKRIIDQIDDAIGEYLGFSAAELDFLKSYLVKYRMGIDQDTDG